MGRGETGTWAAVLSWAGRGCSILQERFVVHVTDVLAVSMMLGITAQVKEAGVVPVFP